MCKWRAVERCLRTRASNETFGRGVQSHVGVANALFTLELVISTCTQSRGTLLLSIKPFVVSLCGSAGLVSVAVCRLCGSVCLCVSVRTNRTVSISLRAFRAALSCRGQGADSTPTPFPQKSPHSHAGSHRATQADVAVSTSMSLTLSVCGLHAGAIRYEEPQHWAYTLGLAGA